MGDYKGKNTTISLRRQTADRAKYASEVFKDNENVRHPSVSDYNFSERVYYGRIDTEDDIVVPIPKKMKRIGGTTGTVNMVLPFVKDMWTHFTNKFEQAVTLGNIPDNEPFLSKVNIYSSYTNPIVLYDKHISSMLDTFNNDYLSILEYSKEVIDYNSYVKHFIKYSKILGREFPVTLTGFQRSKRSQIFTNGITISIAPLDASDDAIKEEEFLAKPCIDFYLNAAKQYGFSVTKNAPWILVADLESISTKVYLEKYGLSSTQQIFQAYYRKTYTVDLQLLSASLQTGYNNFVEKYAFVKNFSVCKKSIDCKRIYRQKISNKVLSRDYGMNYWIPLYIDLRNYEDKEPYNSAEIYRMKQKAFSFQNLLDSSRSMRYINEQFRIKHKYAEGGIPYYAERFQKRLEGE